MRKIKKILQLFAFVLVTIATALTINNSTSKAENYSVSGYSGSLDVYMTEQFFVKDDLSNVVTSPVPGGKYYLTFVLNVNSGLTTFGFAFRVNKDANSTFTYNFATPTEAQTYLMGEGYTMAAMGYSQGMATYMSMDTKSCTANGWSGGSKIDANATAMALNTTYTSGAGLTGNALSLQGAGGSLSAGRYILGKCYLELSTTSPSFKLENTTLITNGADGTVNYPAGVSSFDYEANFGSASDKTTMSTATVKGNNDSTTSNLSFNGTDTYSGTVGYNSTTASVNLVVEDSGTITDVKNANGTSIGTTIPFTMNLGATNSTTTYTVEVLAQDGSTNATYSISVKRGPSESCVLTNLTATGSTAASVSLSPSFAAATTSYTLKYASTLTALSLTPTWDTATNCTVTVKKGSGNFTAHSSGNAIDLTSMIASGGTVQIKVQSQYDTVNGESSKTKLITVTLTKENIDLYPTVQVFDASSNTQIGTVNYDSVNDNWSFEVPYSYTAVYFKAVPASGHSITSYTPGGSGSNSGNISSSTYGASGGTTATFIVRNNTFTSETKTCTVKLTRGSADTKNYLEDEYLALNSTDSSSASTNVYISYGNRKFTHEFDFGVTEVYYNFTKAHSGQKVKYSVTNSASAYTLISTNYRIPISTTPTTYYIKVEPEDANGTPLIYELTLSASPGSDNSTPLLPFRITDGTNEYTVVGSGTTSDAYKNATLIPYSYPTATFVINSGESHQTLYYSYTTNSSGFSGMTSSMSSTAFGTGPMLAFSTGVFTATTIYVKIEVRSQAYSTDSTKKSTYYLTILRAAADSTKELTTYSITNQDSGATIDFDETSSTSTNKVLTSRTTYAYKVLPNGVNLTATFKGKTAAISVTSGGTYSGDATINGGTSYTGNISGSATYSTYSITELVIRIVITAENTQTFTYMFKILRVAASTDGTLQTKTVLGHLDGQSNYLTNESSVDMFYYNIAKKYNGNNQTSFDLSLVANDSEAKIAVYTTDTSTPSFAGASNTVSQTVSMNTAATYGETKVFVYVLTEAETKVKYTFIVKYPDDRNQTVSITNITSTKIPSSEYTFVDGNYTPNTIHVAYNISSVDLKVTLDDTKASGVVLNNTVPCQAATAGVVDFTSIPLNNPGTTTTLVLIPVAENNTLTGNTYTYTGNSYTLVIEREPARTDQEILSYRETYGTKSDETNNQYQTSNQIFVNVGRTSNTSTYRVKFTISPYAGYQISATSSAVSNPVSVSGDTNGQYIEPGTVLEFTVTGLVTSNYVTISIKVMSESVQYSNGTANYYTIYVFKADEANDVTSIKLFSDSAKTKEIKDTQGQTYALSNPVTNTTLADADRMTINYSAANEAYYTVAFSQTTSSYARVSSVSTAQPKSLVTGSSGNVIHIITVSEYCYLRQQIDPSYSVGQQDYFIIIIRNAADTNDLLDTFEAKLASSSGTVIVESGTLPSSDTTTCRYTRNGDSFNIEYLPNDVASVWVQITAESDLAIFTVNTVTGLTNATTRYVMLDVSGISNSVKIFNMYIYPESDRTNGHPYTVNISRTTINLSNNNERGTIKISYDEVTDQAVHSGNTYTLVHNSTGATIVATAVANTAIAKITVYDATRTTVIQTINDNSYVVTVSNLLPGTGVKYALVFDVISGSGTKNPDEFVFYVERQSPSDETGLKEIVVRNTTTNYEVTISNPTPGTQAAPTIVTMPYGTTEVEVTLVGLDSTVQVPDPKTTSDLHLGKNSTENYAVKSQKGTTVKYYVAIFVSGDVKKDVDNIDFVLSVDEAENGLSPDFAMNLQTRYQATLPPTADTANTRLTFARVNWNQYGAYAIAFDTNVDTATLTTYTYRATDLTKEVTIKVYALDAEGNENTDSEYVYTVRFVKRVAETGNYLLSITIDNTPLSDFVKTTNTYYIPVDRSKTRVSITNLTADTGAKIEADGSNYADASEVRTVVLTAGTYKLFEVIVTSESENPNPYKFYLIPAEKDKNIVDISFLTSSTGTNLTDIDSNGVIVNYNSQLYNYAGTVNFTQSKGYLRVRTSGANQKLFINGTLKSLNNSIYGGLEEFSVGTPNVYTIYTLSEYDYIVSTIDNTWITDHKVGDYVITINVKEADSDATLKELYVQAPDGTILTFEINSFTSTGTFVAGTGTSDYSIIGVGDTLASVTSYATPTKRTTQVLGAGILDMSSDASNQYIYTIKIETLAEDGVTSCKYTISIARGQLNLDDDNTITLIKLYDSNNNWYCDDNKNSKTQYVFATSKTSYPNINIPYGAQSITFSAAKLGGSECKIYYKTGNQTGVYSEDGAKSIQVLPSMLGKTITYTVYGVSKNGTSGTEYTFEVTFLRGSANSAITLFTWNGTKVAGFDYNDLSTTSANNFQSDIVYIEYSDWSSITISAIQDDPKASLSGDVGSDFELIVGRNTFTVYCTPEDGSQASVYKLIIYRMPQTPFIELLETANGELFNADGSEKTAFKSDEYKYVVKIKYAFNSDILTTTVTETDFEVNGTNSNKSINGSMSASFSTASIQPGGSITVKLTVSSKTTGASRSYTVVIQRASKESADATVSSIDIKGLDNSKKVIDQIDEFEYKIGITDLGNYDVQNIVTSLDVSVIAAQAAEGASFEVYGPEKLQDGKNTYVVVCTSADNSAQSVYTFTVTRAPMEWDVNKEASNYQCDESERKISYSVKMKDGDATKVDWTKYIVFDETKNAINVQVVSDVEADSKQVVIMVDDGSVQSYVTMNLTYDKGPVFDWWIIGILIADVIILTAILISVNRDKYGKVTKKRKEI